MSKFFQIAEVLLKHLVYGVERYDKNIMIYNDLIKEFPIIKNYSHIFDFNKKYSFNDWESIINDIEKIENRKEKINEILK